MKKTTQLNFAKFSILLFAIFLSTLSYGQCINSIPFGSYTVTNSGNVESINSCTYTQEYNTLSGLIVGENYIFTAVLNSDNSQKFITVTNLSNAVIFFGISPLTVNSITSADVRLHITDNSSCATTNSCHSTTVQFLADCPSPTSLSIAGVTTTSATATWTAVGPGTLWDFEYGLSGFVLGTGILVPNLSVTNYNFTGLNSGTSYQYYVRTKCTSENSLWTAPFTFTTVCLPVTEFVENFDTTDAIYGGPLPACWSKGGDNSFDTYITSGSDVPGTAPNRLYMVAEGFTPTETFASLPVVSNLQANTHRLRFKAFSPSGTDRILQVGYLTDPNNVGSFQFLVDYILPGTQTSSAVQFTLVPGVLPANAQRLTFRNSPATNEYNEIYIDDVRWEAIPSCIEPNGVFADNILATTATIIWSAPTVAPANGYDYFISTSSTEPTATAIPTGSVAAGVTTAALTGLTGVTQYFVWVRSVCASSNYSYWTSIYSFTTPCASYIPFYLEDFSTFTFAGPPTCWNKFADGNLSTGPSGAINSGDWYDDLWLNGPSNVAAKINLYGTFPKGWLVSPVFDLSAGGYEVKYDVGTTQWNQTGPINGGVMGSDDFVYLLMSVNGGSTWTTMETYNAANTPPNSGITEVLNITSTTSNAVKFAYYATSGATSGGTDYDFFVDNFIIQTIPVSVPTCSNNVTATINAGCGNFPTILSWSVASGSNGYKLSIGTSAGGTDILNNFIVSELTYSFSGSLNTTYYYKVVPYNTFGDAVGCTEQTFTTASTGCYCVANPSSNDNLGITNVVLGTTNFTTPDVTYYDHTATTVITNQGANTNLQITFETGYTYNTFVWIDFNDNYIFDTGELIATNESTNTSPTTLNASFVMPANATLGLHTMRLGTSDFAQVPPDPCYLGFYGVYLDFKVNVQPALNTDTFDSANFRAYPNPVKDLFTISYSNTITDVVVYNLLGQQVLSAKPNSNVSQIDMSGLTRGSYLIKVTSDNLVKSIKIIKN